MKPLLQHEWVLYWFFNSIFSKTFSCKWWKSGSKDFPQGRTRFPHPCLNTHSNQKMARKSGTCVRHTTGNTRAVVVIAGFGQGPKRRHQPIRPIPSFSKTFKCKWWKSRFKDFPLRRTRFPQPCLNTHYNQKTTLKSGACVRHTTRNTRGFGQGPKPCHQPIRPTNRAKKPMTHTLHCPPPLAPTLGWR